MEQCLKGGTCGMEPCWGSAGRAAACGKLMQDQFGKDGIHGRDPHGPEEESDQEGAAQMKYCV